MVALSLLKKDPPKKPDVNTTPLVEIAEVDIETVQFDVDSQGIVSPLMQTTLSAEVSGAVISLSDNFIAGGKFNAGDVLARIDPLNYQVNVERAEAALAQRQIEYDGAKKLGDQGYRSATELATAKAALVSAEADLTRAQRDLERSIIRAPYDGLVLSRATELGNFVNTGAQLGVIFASDVAEVRLPVPDPDLAFLTLPTAANIGTGPEVTLVGSYRGRDHRWPATVVRTEGVVDERTRMVFVVARIDDPYALDTTRELTAELPIGTFVTAEIKGIVLEDVVRIPRQLVRASNNVIFVDPERKLRFRELEIIRTDADFAYVYADQLLENQLLMTRLEAPLNGMLVRTTEDIDAPPDADSENAESASDDGAEASDATEPVS
ncbi:MAG: efflux RND transporter periplasmic adaptor subunit [Pseudomonadota bacterium]